MELRPIVASMWWSLSQDKRAQDCELGYCIKASPVNRGPGARESLPSFPTGKLHGKAYPLAPFPHSEEPNAQAFPQHVE